MTELNNQCDVLIIGAGPSGASAAYWLSKYGVSVVVLEKKTFPREKTCGDGLTPRSVFQLEAMGMGDFLETTHRYDGLRAVALKKEMELSWPDHPDLPSYGYVVTRFRLDEAVAKNAENAGATILQGHEAVSIERDPNGKVTAVEAYDKASSTTVSFHPKYLLVGDGSNSRIGRLLGAKRDRSLPMGLALRGYFSSPLSGDPFIESHLDIRTKEGEILPGYGWIFPLGDGRVNVGIGLLSTLGKWKDVNTTKVMEAFVENAPKRWGLSLDDPIYVGTGGKLPMGLSVSPRVGSNFILIGDASGTINPMNGEGIAYGYETGRLAAGVIFDALSLDDPSILSRYERSLESIYGNYYRVARAFVGLIGHPTIMRASVGLGMNSKSIMTPIVRIMANLMRPNHIGTPEALYQLGLGAVKTKDLIWRPVSKNRAKFMKLIQIPKRPSVKTDN
ncbi:geranylgeranyl reductase family protein [Acidithrix ferrooxidans]|uniref:Putative oxidoreductasec n=2 Tax=root TaxID=1 RepID=A0A0D8HE84_9ACTN|nr:geranylgeranyl reductase family protein [Acidithrix ferrooxidans]KJF16199.1 putative oxidoreductasec [Acidithrix ferrooxidans]